MLQNVVSQNPAISDFVTCATYQRIPAEVPSWTFNDFPNVLISRTAPNTELRKAVIAFLFEPEGHIRQLLVAPGRVLPVLKAIAGMPQYRENPIIEKYAAEVELMSEAAARGCNLGWESARHKPDTKAGEIVNSNVLAEMAQRVCLDDENIATVVGETADRIDEIMRSC